MQASQRVALSESTSDLPGAHAAHAVASKLAATEAHFAPSQSASERHGAPSLRPVPPAPHAASRVSQPDGQLLHAVSSSTLPASFWYVPAAQLAHAPASLLAVAPPARWCFPAAHVHVTASQAVCAFAASVNVIGGHVAHAAASLLPVTPAALRDVPAGHSTVSVALHAGPRAASPEYVPGAHAVHSTAPVVFWYHPAGQRAQLSDSRSLVAPARWYRPGGHRYESAAHAVSSEQPTPLCRPAGHAAQLEHWFAVHPGHVDRPVW